MHGDPVAHRWSLGDIADALAEGLSRLAEQDRLEQAVRGFDSFDELGLHPHLHAILRDAGFGVWREQRYPADRRRRRRAEGERCDIVLTHDARTLAAPDAEPTLFAPTDAVLLEEALWIEVKVVAQFNEEGPNAGYASDLQEPLRRDVAKLARDASIGHAALLLVLFTADRLIAEHDLAVWHERCLQRGLPVELPYQRHIEIVDRLGNRLCTVALFPVRREGPAIDEA